MRFPPFYVRLISVSLVLLVVSRLVNDHFWNNVMVWVAGIMLVCGVVLMFITKRRAAGNAR